MTTVQERATGLTLEAFLARPDTKPASEYAYGEAIQKPMPDHPHAILQFFFQTLIHQFLRGTPIGRVAMEWRCTFGPSGGRRAIVPDVTYVSYARMPKGDPRVNRYPWGAPDLIIEVLSEDQPFFRFVDKLIFCLLNGVRLTWVVDPRAELVLVLAPGRDSRVLQVGDTLDGGDVLPGFAVSVAEIMAQLLED